MVNPLFGIGITMRLRRFRLVWSCLECSLPKPDKRIDTQGKNPQEKAYQTEQECRQDLENSDSDVDHGPEDSDDNENIKKGCHGSVTKIDSLRTGDEPVWGKVRLAFN